MTLQLNPIISLTFLSFITIAIVSLIFLLSKKYKNNLNNFLVSNRNIGWFVGALSVAVTWVWAPALLVSSQQAFEKGLPGIFWFIIPNTLALILIGTLIPKLKERMPDGFTLPEFIKKNLGKKNHILYIGIILLVQIYSIIIHLTAILLILSPIINLSKSAIIMILSIIFLLLASIRGIRSSIFSDLVKFIFIFVIILFIIPLTIYFSGGLSTLFLGLGGINGQYTNIFDLNVFLTFGIAISISLLSGATIDQQLWQRAFSIKKGEEKKAFYLGAIIFFLIPLFLSTLGFIAANKTLGLSILNNQLAGYNVILTYLPNTLVLIFISSLTISLFAAGASALCAASSVFTIDIYSMYINRDSSEKKKLFIGRISMILILFLGMLIAFIPNIQIVYLVMLIGSIRGALLIPTIIIIYKKNVSSKAFFISSIMGIIFGLPLFILGTIIKNPLLSSIGALLSVGISGLIILVSLKLKKYIPKND